MISSRSLLESHLQIKSYFYQYIYITHNIFPVNNEERIKLTKTIKGEIK